MSPLNHIEKRKKRRRKILPGFPWEGKSQTKQEIDNYFSGDKLQCLLCGKRFQKIPTHLNMIHGISSDEYREMCGLPWKRGLCGEEVSSKLGAAMKRKKWLGRHKRFHIHFTPTGASWMNQVETWFGIPQAKRIKRGVFISIKDLVEKIEDFIEHYNKNPQTSQEDKNRTRNNGQPKSSRMHYNSKKFKYETLVPGICCLSVNT